MTKFKIAIGLAALVGTASASAYTGNDLLSDLQSGDSGRQLGGMQWIVGYIEGLQDSSLDFSCRDGVTHGQLTDVVRVYLERNPNERDSSAGMEVYLAVAMAGICRYDKSRGDEQIEKLKQRLQERNKK